MFESVCDCCGKRGSLNVYILRIEKISDPSIAIRYDMGDAEVIPNKYRDEQTIKYLLCSHCYSKTGLPLFSFGKNRRFDFFKPLMEFKECKFCHAKGDGAFSCELTHFADGKCHFAMRDCKNPKFGEEPTYCEDYKGQE
jgi:hypothetical protein